MKKILILLLSFILCTVPCLAVEGNSEVAVEPTTEATTEAVTQKAEETTSKKQNETEKQTEAVEERVEVVTEDMSQPRLMVTGYKVQGSYLTPEKDGVVSVTLKNMHNSKSVRNIKLSVGEDSDEICAEGMGTKYVSYIGAGNTYTWDIAVTTAYNATVGVHKLNFICEYEDKNGAPYSESATLRVEVRQPVKLTFDGAVLPVKVVQDDTVTVNVNLMNTGKAEIYNCKVDFDITGLSSGGSSFAGEIPVGESKTATANLRVDSEKTGNVEGVIKITYEDTFGKVYEQTAEVKTIIEKKVVKAQKEEPEEKKYPLWWLFVLIGLIVGGGLGFGIPFAINSKKQREEDERRL